MRWDEGVVKEAPWKHSAFPSCTLARAPFSDSLEISFAQ